MKRQQQIFDFVGYKVTSSAALLCLNTALCVEISQSNEHGRPNFIVANDDPPILAIPSAADVIRCGHWGSKRLNLTTSSADEWRNESWDLFCAKSMRIWRVTCEQVRHWHLGWLVMHHRMNWLAWYLQQIDDAAGSCLHPPCSLDLSVWGKRKPYDSLMKEQSNHRIPERRTPPTPAEKINTPAYGYFLSARLFSAGTAWMMPVCVSIWTSGGRPMNGRHFITDSAASPLMDQ